MKPTLSRTQLILFALPALVSVINHAPIVGIIFSLYASSFGLSLTTIASVLLAVRIFDAVIDPLIGYGSDRTRSRLGRRKPWVIAGTIGSVLAMFFLFRPGAHAGLAWFLVLMLALQFFWTVMEIPFTAWVLEISRDADERTRLFAYRSAATLLGGILFTLAPMAIARTGGSMNFEVLGLIAIVMAVAVPLSTAAAVRWVPEGEVGHAQAQPRLSELWASVRDNRPFQVFVLIYVFIGLASGISGVLSFMYLDAYLQIGNRYTEVYLPAVLVGPLSLPVWSWLLRRYDRLRLTAVAFACYALAMPLPWFVAPGPGAFVPIMLLSTLLSLFYPLLMITMPGILGDVIDYDEARTGKNRAGQYNAFLTLIAKGTAAVGGPIGLGLVGWFGYQPGAANSESAIQALRVVNNLLPALLVIPSVLLLWRFPLNAERLKQIRQQLRERIAA